MKLFTWTDKLSENTAPNLSRKLINESFYKKETIIYYVSALKLCSPSIRLFSPLLPVSMQLNDSEFLVLFTSVNLVFRRLV